MNKKLIAVAVSSALAVPVIAQAEGEVKLYGRINQAIDLKDASGADSDTDVSSVASRFGIRYDNDLGNGLAVHGRYEFSTTPDKEEEGISDIRIGTVGISGAFGRLDVGNQWSAYSQSFGTFVSPTYTLGYYIYSAIGGGAFRSSNTLKYSNTFGPVNFKLDGRLNGSDEGSDVAEALRGDGIGVGISFDVGDYVSIGMAADYEDGPDSSDLITGAVTAADTAVAAAMRERAEARRLVADQAIFNMLRANRVVIETSTSSEAEVMIARENLADLAAQGTTAVDGPIRDARRILRERMATLSTATGADIDAARTAVETQQEVFDTLLEGVDEEDTDRINARRYIASEASEDEAEIAAKAATDVSRTDDTTRYGIAVKVKLGELPVSVTGGWQTYDVEQVGRLADGTEAIDTDVDTWFLWVAGDISENTRWQIGYANASGDGPSAATGAIPTKESHDANQYTWGIYHTIGGGLKAYYEGTAVDSDDPNALFDGNRHLLGLRIDF